MKKILLFCLVTMSVSVQAQVIHIPEITINLDSMRLKITDKNTYLHYLEGLQGTLDESLKCLQDAEEKLQETEAYIKAQEKILNLREKYINKIAKAIKSEKKAVDKQQQQFMDKCAKMLHEERENFKEDFLKLQDLKIQYNREKEKLQKSWNEYKTQVKELTEEIKDTQK